jgi:excisionase family DNA binding protein
MRKCEKTEVSSSKLTTQQDETTVDLLTVEQVAQRLTIGVRTVWRLDADKKLPAALRIGHRKRWRASDLELWLNLECPSRKKFEQIKTKERKLTYGENNA